MGKENNTQKNLTDEIIDNMLASINREKEFDNELLKKLEDLYASGGLKRAQRIIECIKPEEEG